MVVKPDRERERERERENGDIPVPANQADLEKWLLKWSERERKTEKSGDVNVHCKHRQCIVVH